MIRDLAARTWKSKEIDDIDNIRNSLDKKAPTEVVDANAKAVPIGEGRVKHPHHPDFCHQPQAKLVFATRGDRKGKYFHATADLKVLGRNAEKPWTSLSKPWNIKVATSSLFEGHKSKKPDRMVVLNDVNKISRLALKFPLPFLDTPCTAAAIFTGVRAPAAADMCAQHFHTTLFPKL